MESRRLPRPVPEKYQLDQRVCEVNQAVLGQAGDPQPVVQNVQVHAGRPTVRRSGPGDEEHRLANGRTASRCDRVHREEGG